MTTAADSGSHKAGQLRGATQGFDLLAAWIAQRVRVRVWL
jgi:hypothetical protein